jgi:hypothetical protein
MKIGGEVVPPEVLRAGGSRRVSAGMTVEITHMEAKFDEC